MEGYNCDISQLPYGICPGVTFGLPWTHAKARAPSNCETALAASAARTSAKGDRLRARPV